MKKYILLLDDDVNLARMFKLYLEKQGLKVICFYDPKQALEKFQLEPASYFLVLTDFRMKGMGRIKFANEIRRMRGNSIFIVLVTAYFLDKSQIGSKIVETIDKVIVKPIPLKKLIDLMNYYLSRTRYT